MSFVKGLKCTECGLRFPKHPIAGCEECFAPLEVDYDYEAIAKALSREAIQSRPNSLWRYRELLPVDSEPVVGQASGATPLIRADRLAAALGARLLYVKNDSVNYPTLSFKDRVTAVAINKAREFGLEAVGCASTGNLANSVAANAAAAGLPAYILIPENLERSKIAATSIYGANLIAVRGNYDDVNRLCTQVADKYSWGFANINLRAYYAEGAKTTGFEIAEQLGWRFPRHVVSPVAGGTLLPRILKGFEEMRKVGLVEGDLPAIHAAQAAGCAPVVRALEAGLEFPEPVKPQTIAKSIAIGNPADGFQVLRAVRSTGGSGAMVEEHEILEGIRLLAETEGIFTEGAGGVTVAATHRLIERGVLPRDESIVICVTGNGYKTIELLTSIVNPVRIGRSLAEFEAALEAETPARTA